MTRDPEPRVGGAWIGQHPDANTQKVRDELDDGAERVAVTNNESDATLDGESRPAGERDDAAPDGDGRPAGDED